MKDANGYMVIKSGDVLDLQEQVCTAMGRGWMPVGGLAVYDSEDFEQTFAQAMVKMEFAPAEVSETNAGACDGPCSGGECACCKGN